MAGIDGKLAQKIKRKAERMLKHAFREHLEKTKFQERPTIVTLAFNSSSEFADDSSNQKASADEMTSPYKRGRINVVTQTVSATLNRTKISDRKAMMVMADTAQSLGHDVEEIALSRSSIRRFRQQHQTTDAKKLKEAFNADHPLVVHWDEKLIPKLTGKLKEDRLPVLVSGKEISQLFTEAKLSAGTRISQAKAVVNALKDWQIDSQVQDTCCDTTSSNTGRLNGTCISIEQSLKKKLLFFACCHHMLELIIGAVFTACMGTSSGPDVPLFKRLQKHWELIDKEKFEDAFTDEYVAKTIADVKDDISLFIFAQLQNNQPRDDYHEILELALVFLGRVPPRGIRFMAPGPMHHARWMNKVIYSLKVWLF